jgi:hypothetical protein
MLGIGFKLRIILLVAGTIAAGVAGWTMNGWRLNAQIDRMVTEHSQALAKANKEALDRYAAMERKKQEALDEANKIAQRNAAAAANARADANRLRNDLAASSNSVPTATVTSLRNYTTTVNFVFAECVREIESLAKTADGHALDSRTLIGAWPK